MLEPLELMSYDARIRLSRSGSGLLHRALLFSKTPEATAGVSPVVLVKIDDASLEKLGQWPWPRSTHARLVNILSRAGARVIGFDILFPEPDSKDIRGDQMLARASGAAGNVVYAGSFLTKFVAPGSKLFQGNGDILPVGPLRKGAASIGHIVALPDEDGVLRRLPVAVRGQGGLYFCFPVELARIYLGIRGDSVRLIPGRCLELGELVGPGDLGGRGGFGEPGRPGRLGEPDRLGGLNGLDGHLNAQDARVRQVPLDPASSMLVNYLGRNYLNYNYPGREGFKTFSYHRVLAGQVPASEFDGKVVIVGVEAKGLRDFYPTPLSTRGEVTSGLYINALALDTILSGEFIKRVNPYVTLGAIVAGGLAAAGPTSLARLFILAALAAGAGLLALMRYGLWLDIVPVITAMLVSYVASLARALVDERKRRDEVRRAFERYVTPEAVREILAAPGGYALGGSRRTVTVLFADIRGFTAFAETRDPEEVVGILNRYLGAMGDAVLREGGTLDKFMGDGIMAIFGAPVPLEDHASRAVRAALGIVDEVERLEEELGYGLQVGIGIATGEAVVGNIGTRRRMDYTAIGSAVNLASRLEELAGPRQVLMDGETHSMVRDHFHTPVTWESLGHVAVRGRTGLLEVWNLKKGGEVRGDAI
ncbi:MAG TPA: adenylate/guanylate cyclase domain-containing protein [Firmicutes bacterium]|nr:adenylate/guanylate cyclase domain-containing protein [Bacillota bacterium]